ncbi:hypothetical protein EVAR_48991_1 [Eumeta japonica]|uniref:Uncharacterized protein n=1 Tax=Eumeta variegata TaxID=151549 RepID=A0A4C1Z063_EUMVA|nr:hypothetical protein EVAR_48991_1 [Eumeta japonica]
MLEKACADLQITLTDGEKCDISGQELVEELLKELFSEYRGLQSVLDAVALNAAWVARAEPDLLRHFTGQR